MSAFPNQEAPSSKDQDIIPPGENIPPQTGPNRMPDELWEIIQIPQGGDPFVYENLWETELCDFFEDCSECERYSKISLNFKII